MKPSRFSGALVFGGCFLVLFGSGCSGKGSKTGDVSGTVNLDGSPLPFGLIKFVASDSTKAKEKEKPGEIKDGAFEVKGVPVGDSVTVTIDTEKAAAMYNPDTLRRGLAEKQASRASMLAGAKDKGQAPDTTQIDEEIAKIKEDLKKAEDLTKKLKGKKVPTKYGDEKTSTIKVKITGGAQTLDPIELKSGN